MPYVIHGQGANDEGAPWGHRAPHSGHVHADQHGDLPEEKQTKSDREQTCCCGAEGPGQQYFT